MVTVNIHVPCPGTSTGWAKPRSRPCSDSAREAPADNGYAKLSVTGQHAVNIDGLPPLDKDPFDRLLLAPALTEGVTLLTSDAQLARYPGPVRKV